MHENLNSAVLPAIPCLCWSACEYHQTSAGHRRPVRCGPLLPHATQRADAPTVLVWDEIQRGGHTLVTQLSVEEAGCKLRPLNKSSVG